MNNCQTCRWWNRFGGIEPVGWGLCGRLRDRESGLLLEDEDGNALSPLTAPDFGCVRWMERKGRDS